jgi:hypothetical protein
METDWGLGGLVRIYSWVEGKGLHVAGVRMAGWDYGGLSFLFYFLYIVYYFFIFLSSLTFKGPKTMKIVWITMNSNEKSKEFEEI